MHILVTRWKIAFILCVLALTLTLGFNMVQGENFQPGWLHPGCSATYAFGQSSASFGDIMFNESRAYGQISGNCRWTIVTAANGIATLEFEFDLTIPGYNTSDEYVAAIKAHQVVTTVDYTGKEFVDLAKKGDFSFVKTLPRAQIDTQKVEIVDNPDRNGAYLVVFWCGFHIQETFNVVVNLQDLND